MLQVPAVARRKNILRAHPCLSVCLLRLSSHYCKNELGHLCCLWYHRQIFILSWRHQPWRFVKNIFTMYSK